MNINKDFALFYGIMLGDGCLSYSKRKRYIAIALNLKDDKPFLEEIILPLLFQFTNKHVAIRVRKRDGCIGVNFTNKKFFEFLNVVGFPIGKKGTTVRIPNIFYKKNLLKHICQGLFATDGSLVLTDNNGTFYPRVEICSISEPLMRQVNNYLNANHIKCNFYEAKRKKENKKWNQRYRLQINGKTNLAAFVKSIGFVNPKQKERLLYYLMKVARVRVELTTSSL